MKTITMLKMYSSGRQWSQPFDSCESNCLRRILMTKHTDRTNSEQISSMADQQKQFDEINTVFMKMKAIAFKATDESLTDEERQKLQKEMDSLKQRLDALYASMLKNDKES